MIDFEDQLRIALARKKPPTDFAGRVAAEVKRNKREHRGSWKHWAAGCIAASLLAGALEMKQLEDRRDSEKAQTARTQLLRALRITSRKLHQIQQKVEGVN